MHDSTPARRGVPWRGLAIAVTAGAVAVAGTATAQELIDGRTLVNGSVTRAKLQLNAIGNAQIAAGAVTTSEIRARAVRSANIANGAVLNAAIANGAVTRAKIARSAVDGERIVDGSITAADIGPGAALPSVTTRALEVTIQPGPGQSAEVSCLAGEVALGGGYASIPPQNANVLNNRPIPAANASRPTGWSVFVVLHRRPDPGGRVRRLRAPVAPAPPRAAPPGRPGRAADAPGTERGPADVPDA